MRVAINALAMRSLGHGVGNYIANLGLALSEQFPGDNYTFFIRPDNKDLPNYLSHRPNVAFEVVSLPRPVRLLWEQLVLPFKVRSYDVLHSPVYVAPFLKFTRYVLTELDMSVFVEPAKYSLVKRIYFRTMIPLSCRRVDKILAISNSAASDLRRILKIPASKVVTSPLGIRADLNRINDRKVLAKVKSKLDLPDKYILFLGVLEPRKNVAGLVDAFAKISSKVDLDLVIAGSRGFGWNNKRVYELVRKYGLASRIHFVGTVEEADKAALYSLATIFVYPSFYEGFGIPVLEAMACGVPVITSKGSSLEEISGGAAILINPRDQNALAQGIKKIFHDKNLSRRLVKLGFVNARKYNWSATAKETRRAYV